MHGSGVGSVGLDENEACPIGTTADEVGAETAQETALELEFVERLRSGDDGVGRRDAGGGEDHGVVRLIGEAIDGAGGEGGGGEVCGRQAKDF